MSHDLLLRECFKAQGPEVSALRDEHCLELVVERDDGEFVARLTYLSGTLLLASGQCVAEFKATFDVGEDQVDIGQGRTDINIPELRGIGIGGFLMAFLITLVKQRLPRLNVSPIQLSIDDAETDEARDRRNRFWEKLGFVFDYGDPDRRWGHSKPMRTDALREQPYELALGWTLLEVTDCEGCAASGRASDGDPAPADSDDLVRADRPRE